MPRLDCAHTILQPKFFKGKYQDTNTFVKLPLQVATEREIASQQYRVAGRSLSDWTVRLKDFPHPALDAASLIGQVIGPFLFAASMFSYVPVVCLPVSVSSSEFALADDLVCSVVMINCCLWLLMLQSC